MRIRLQISAENHSNQQASENITDAFIESDGQPLFQISQRKVLQLEKRRAATTVALQELDLADTDPVCLHMSDGFEWWMSARDAAEQFHRGKVEINQDQAHCEIDPEAVLAGNSRANGSHILQSIEGFALDLCGRSAFGIAQWLEKKYLFAGKTALLQLALQHPAPQLQTLSAPVASNQAAILVLIHGTASNTTLGFADLWKKSAQSHPATQLHQPMNTSDELLIQAHTAAQSLHTLYGERVYAFEYASLTASAIENALQLAQALPAQAEIHLLSHSQGGLIGELLCLGARAGQTLSSAQLQLLFAQDRSAAQQWGLPPMVENGYAQQLQALEALIQLLAEKQFKITRFVRIACPAMGTTLASGKLDRWLSILKYLCKLAGNFTLAEHMLAFLLAVIKQRTDPRTLPGIEGMMPGSALQRLLNRPDLEVDADLSVIAGDIEDKSLLGWFKLVASNRFFASRHDLVVNTGSMYGGLRRRAGHAHALLEQGKNVSHFNYFANPRSVQAILGALTRQGAGWTAFSPLLEQQRAEPARGMRAPSANLASKNGLAIIIPGTMGSELSGPQGKVWVNLLALMHGGMQDIAAENKQVKADAINANYYAALTEFLEQSHEVLCFAYDWRLSVQVNAKLLATLIEQQLPTLERLRLPLRLLAHSMGGLVARVMAAQRPDLWRRMKALPGFRLMMFGTPNFGSYQSIRMLVAQHYIVNCIALLDIYHDRQAIQAIITGFISSSELFPSKDARFDFSKLATWQKLRDETAGDWPLPSEAALQIGAQTRELILSAPIDPKTMIYVAGWDSETPNEVTIENRPGLFSQGELEITFYSTRRGDGTVAWDLGILPGVPTYYVTDAAHDQLLNCPKVFDAYLELMLSGSTRRLPNQEPQLTRGDALERRRMPADTPQYHANLENFGGFGGANQRRTVPAKQVLPTVNISIRHGDLAYALYPVCVGHYQGDTVVSAEKQLDIKLDGMLHARAKLGIYPGRLGTWAVCIAREAQTRPGGAIVVGLGQVGELTPGALESGLCSALVDYGLQVANWHDARFGDKNGLRQARLSFLLIGTGAGGISIQDSVNVILRSVQKANQKLSQQSGQALSYIDQIEILELFYDVALQAAQALKIALRDQEMAAYFQWQPCQLASGGSGLHRAQFDQAQSWWQRTEISFDAKRQELRFVALTNRARAEQSLVAGQMRMAKDFVRQAIGNTNNQEDIARTLFEMLIPNRLKEFAPERQDVVLLLDEEAAWFPWEMMEDRWSENSAPPAVDAGFIRQLKTSQFRAAPLTCTENSIFIVGNPLPCKIGHQILNDLPGAKTEAELVAQQFRKAGFQVRQEIEQGADRILIGLHGAAYRILHLAGHGVHQFATTVHEELEDCISCEQTLPREQIKVSGMVIGDNVLLTPADVEQMRWVPELVFINCCHLGTMREGAGAARHNELAANLAAQFIRMGVRAVVAAGWEVNDDAACAFAEEFYGAMLAGIEFGHAVQHARKSIFKQFRAFNTWGAYQCYGDPDFRLTAAALPIHEETLTPYFSCLELITDLNNLTRRARFGNAQESDLQSLLKRIPQDNHPTWLAQADVAAALGQAYGELELFALAVEHLDQAIAAEKSELSLTALEQRANFKARHALNLWQSEAEQTSVLELFAQAQSEIESLLAFAPTMERYNLQASNWKRYAICLSEREQRLAALNQMAQAYGKSVALGQQKNLPHSHALLNLQLAQVLQSVQLPLPNEAAQKITLQCKAIFQSESATNRATPDFWAASAMPQSILVAALANGDLAEKRHTIVELFRHAKQPGASRREMASLRDNLLFISSMLRDQPSTVSAAQSVEKIAAELERF